MRRFWEQRSEDEVERLLRSNRAEPSDEFVASLVGRLEARRSASRPQRLGRRVLVAAAVTALAVGAGFAAGGVHVAQTSLSNLVQVAKSGVNGPNQNPNNNGNNGNGTGNGNGNGGAGDQQYTVEICHKAGKSGNWQKLYLPPEAVAAHLREHQGDFVVTPTTPCPPQP